MNIGPESAHDGVYDCPFPVVIDLVNLVHERCPFFEGTLFIHRDIPVREFSKLLVLVVIGTKVRVNLAEGRGIVVYIVMRDDTQVVRLINSVLVIHLVKDGVGERVESFLLLSESFQLDTFRVIITHGLADPFEMLHLPVLEIKGFLV